MNLINVKSSKFVSKRASSANFKVTATFLMERADRPTF